MFLGISPGIVGHPSHTSSDSYGSGVGVVQVAGGFPLLRSFWDFQICPTPVLFISLEMSLESMTIWVVVSNIRLKLRRLPSSEPVRANFLRVDLPGVFRNGDFS